MAALELQQARIEHELVRVSQWLSQQPQPNETSVVHAAAPQETGQTPDRREEYRAGPGLEAESEIEQQYESEDQRFAELESPMAYEEYDPNWDGKMQQSLQEVTQRLTDLQLPGTEIVYSDCRSSSCYVEFSHAQDQVNVLPSVLFATRAASQVEIRQVPTKHGF